MTLLLPYLLLIAGLILLVKGADWLVSGASAIARHYQIPDVVIGLTVVAFGTSLPELFVNLTASVTGRSGIALGNVLGSNIANILLILGISSIIYPLRVPRGTVWREIPFSLLAAVVLGVLANDRLVDGWAYSDISRSDGMVLLLFFAVFLYYSAAISGESPGMEKAAPSPHQSILRSLVLVAAGLAALAFGGSWIVSGAIRIAQQFGMSEALVGLTIVALGTSLPELATSAVAAWRKNVEIAVGNVVGSNIFNIFLILGASSLVRPLAFQAETNFDIGVVILTSLILFAAMFTGRKQSLDRWEGALLVILYAGYLIYRILMLPS